MQRINKQITSCLLFLCLLTLICTNQALSADPDGKSSLSENSHTRSSKVLPPGGGILMQAFYWDSPEGGIWWDNLSTKMSAWSAAGITAIWLPNPAKSQSGALSMGYDPYDYFDFGDYNQQGTIETRFGSRIELENLISAAHANGIDVYADIVINHNSGGNLEWNPFTSTNTYTDFSVASGKFMRSFADFHPNNIHNNDRGKFVGMPDLCHDQQYVQDWLWKRTDSVGKYYRNVLGFDGWRFDFVKDGFEPWVIREWNANVGGFSVGEYWDSNAQTLNTWADQANSSVFDFALYYAMDNAFDGNNLYALDGAGLAAINPDKAVTFVANHDTDIIWKKKMAYAFILTMEGYPTIFYRDYEEWLDKTMMDNLMSIHASKAVGSTSKLYLDNDEFILQRNGSPGLVLYLNNSAGNKSQMVQTKWANSTLQDFSGNVSGTLNTDANGWVQISAPGDSYSIWSSTSGDGSPDQWYFSGTPNSWGATAMIDIGDNNWEITEKFQANGVFKIRYSPTDWNESYPTVNWNIWQGAGDYNITFNSVPKSITVLKLDQLDQWYFSGTPNNWAAMPMTDIGNNDWQITQYFQANGTFKIRHDEDNWNESYPAQNWNIWQGVGNYEITFNSASKNIAAAKQ